MLNVEPSNFAFLKTHNADKQIEMTCYSVEPRTIKYVKGYGFLLFARKLLHTGRDSLKAASRKEVHETGKFLGNKIAGKIEKPKYVIDENPRNVKEIIILPEKIKEILKKLRHYKTL